MSHVHFGSMLHVLNVTDDNFADVKCRSGNLCRYLMARTNFRRKRWKIIRKKTMVCEPNMKSLSQGPDVIWAMIKRNSKSQWTLFSPNWPHKSNRLTGCTQLNRRATLEAFAEVTRAQQRARRWPCRACLPARSRRNRARAAARPARRARVPSWARSTASSGSPATASTSMHWVHEYSSECVLRVILSEGVVRRSIESWWQATRVSNVWVTVQHRLHTGKYGYCTVLDFGYSTNTGLVCGLFMSICGCAAKASKNR